MLSQVICDMLQLQRNAIYNQLYTPGIGHDVHSLKIINNIVF